MKKVLALILLCAAGWGAVTRYHAHFPVKGSPASTAAATMLDRQPPVVPASPPATEYSCDGRVYCSQMTSCDEAKYFLAHCPGVKMDGDGDGVPCERQFCGG